MGDFAEFKSHFGADERGFGYIKITTGDEMSKRSKFVFCTWVGPNVSVMKKAKIRFRCRLSPSCAPLPFLRVRVRRRHVYCLASVSWGANEELAAVCVFARVGH